jgi:hypothetical protein
MQERIKQGLTLARPAAYKIKVAGQLDASWPVPVENIEMTVESEENDQSVTTLTGVIDQAALQGLLRRLYALGLPLISVNCVEYACWSDNHPFVDDETI